MGWKTHELYDLGQKKDDLTYLTPSFINFSNVFLARFVKTPITNPEYVEQYVQYSLARKAHRKRFPLRLPNKRKKDPNTHTKKKQIFQENLGRDIKMLKIGK